LVASATGAGELATRRHNVGSSRNTTAGRRTLNSKTRQTNAIKDKPIFGSS
jgi:hypothetical protein